MAEKRMPRVSIGLPVFNGAKYLDQALAALSGQTYGDFELIVSDNASTDATREICLAHAARDPRIRYYRNDRNLGAARNYNRVWELSRGELFKWASHDDLCAPTLLERCVAALDQDAAAVLSYPRTVIIDSLGKPMKTYPDDLYLYSATPRQRFRKYLFRSSQECNAIFGLIRSAALRGTLLIGRFNASDQVLLAELSLRGKFIEIGEELFFRRDHPETSLRANPSASAVAAWFDPQNRRRIVLPVWRLYGELARCVLRAELGALERACCLALVAKRFWWQRDGWGGEIFALPRQLTRTAAPPGSGKGMR